MKAFPLFYYPTTVMVIDDDLLFLEALRGYLKNKLNLRYFSNPREALDYFSHYTPPSANFKMLRGCIEQESYHLTGHHPVDLDFNLAREFRVDPNRAKEISTLIIDYNMPGINGIEICRQLKTLPIKKILLTGEASSDEAIDAFNEGLIDCYLHKSNLNLPKEILKTIDRLTHEYLSVNTTQLSNHLKTDTLLPFTDPIFVDHFQTLTQQYAIHEYFILDQHGNFLLIDKHQKHYYLIVHTNRTLNQFTEIYDENTELKHLIREIQTRRKIPFFGEATESWNVDLKKWPPYFFDAQILRGRENYYWAIIEK